MSKRHICIIVAPFYGHTNPVLPIIAELTRAGYRVTCPITQKFAAEFIAVGAEPIVYTALTGDQSMKACSLDELSQLIASYAVADQLAIFEQTQAYYAENRPDVIVHGSANLVGRVFAAKLDVPSIQLFESFADNHVFSLFTALFGENHPCMLEMVRNLHIFLERAGVPVADYMRAEASRYIVFNAKPFQYEGSTFDDSFHFVGPCLRPANHEGEWLPPEDNERPIVYISLGTVFTDAPEFFRMCVQAFADKGWYVVMAIGRAVDPADLGEVPAHFEIHRHVPQLAVLHHADVFISHSGMNSTMESLYFGVPLVSVPQMPEQELVAKRVVQLGLGKLALPAQLTADKLYQCVAEVFDSAEISARAEQIQRLIRRAGGAKEAARVIRDVACELDGSVETRVAMGA